MRVNESRRLWWAGRVAFKGEMRSTKFLLEYVRYMEDNILI
jgi:hypothetical protein